MVKTENFHKYLTHKLNWRELQIGNTEKKNHLITYIMQQKAQKTLRYHLNYVIL